MSQYGNHTKLHIIYTQEIPLVGVPDQVTLIAKSISSHHNEYKESQVSLITQATLIKPRFVGRTVEGRWSSLISLFFVVKI